MFLTEKNDFLESGYLRTAWLPGAPASTLRLAVSPITRGHHIPYGYQLCTVTELIATRYYFLLEVAAIVVELALTTSGKFLVSTRICWVSPAV